MAASDPALHPSMRESPARVDSERSGPPLPRGRAVACETRRDRRSPPPSAQKRRAPSIDAPAGKRAATDNDDEHSRSSSSRRPSLPQPDKVNRRLWEPGDSQRAAIVGECRGVDEIGNCGISDVGMDLTESRNPDEFGNRGISDEARSTHKPQASPLHGGCPRAHRRATKSLTRTTLH